MKKVFQPFWSYNILKTERWLSQMAETGYSLQKFNRITRCFYFNEGNPETLTYRISFDKSPAGVMSSTLRNAGWSTAASSGHWKVAVNSETSRSIQTSPVRDGILKHNRVIFYIFLALLGYLSVVLVAGISGMGSTWLQDGADGFVPSPRWSLTFIFFVLVVLLLVLSIYSVNRISKTNKELSAGAPNSVFSPDQWTSKNAENNKPYGQPIRKLKVGWMYAPDKLEKWLEGMEARGYQLYRVDSLGIIFYFVKGEPRKVRYQADYQRNIDRGYLTIHEDAGWKIVFGSSSIFDKWTIWSRQYSENEETPQFYSEESTHLQHARRVSLLYTAIFLPVMAIYVFNLSWMIRGILNNSSVSPVSVTIYLLSMVLFGSFIYRIWAYYGRLRKTYAYRTN